MTVWAWIRGILAPPVFEDDEDKTRVAALLNAALFIVLFATIAGTVLLITLEPTELVFNLAFGIILVAAIWALWFALRQGHVRAVGALLSCVLWVSITVLLTTSGGLQSSSSAGYFLVIIAASLLLVAESLSAALPMARVGSLADLPPVYGALGTVSDSPHWAVVELPMHVAPAPEYPETKRMYASTLAWWGLVNGYSGFTPHRQVELGRKLEGFPSEQALATMRELGAEQAFSFRQRFVGQEMTVLWEQRRRDGLWTGLTGNYLRVVARAESNLHNKLTSTRLLAVQDDCLVGEVMVQVFGGAGRDR